MVLGTKTGGKVGKKEIAIGSSCILQHKWWEKNIAECKVCNTLSSSRRNSIHSPTKPYLALDKDLVKKIWNNPEKKNKELPYYNH